MDEDQVFPFALMFEQRDDKIVATLVDFQDSANSGPVAWIDTTTNAGATISWIRQTLEMFPCSMVNFGKNPDGAYEMSFRQDIFSSAGGAQIN
jgi:hypothetical protein